MTLQTRSPSEWLGRTVAITGGAGFIGAHLARSLISAGAVVRVFDDFSCSPLLPTEGVVYRGDIIDIDPRELDGVDTVFHLAANKSVPRSFLIPEAAEYNFAMSKALFDAAKAAHVRRVVSASTCEIYGEASIVPTPESSTPRPRSPYARQKLRTEQYAALLSSSGQSSTRYTSVRLFNVFGPGERPDAVVPSLIVHWMLGRRFPIEGPGSQRRDFSYVTNIVGQLLKVPDSPFVPVINLGSGESYSVLELIEVFEEMVERPVKAEYKPGRRNEISEFRSLRDHELAYLGQLDGEIGLRAGLRKTLHWWQQQGVDAALQALALEEESWLVTPPQ